MKHFLANELLLTPRFRVLRFSGFEIPGSTAGGREIVKVPRFQGSRSASQVATEEVLTSVQVPARFQAPGSGGQNPSRGGPALTCSAPRAPPPGARLRRTHNQRCLPVWPSTNTAQPRRRSPFTPTLCAAVAGAETVSLQDAAWVAGRRLPAAGRLAGLSTFQSRAARARRHGSAA